MNETILHYDIVIIGSGAGGGTVAKELSPLCARGAKIALLEWGGFFNKEQNKRCEIGMAEKYYFDQGGFQTTSLDMTLAFARSVGGTTSVYTGTSLVIPEEVLNRWNVPGLTMSDLKPRFEKYIRENNVHLYPPEEINENNRLFVEGCKKLGWKFEQFPVNTRSCRGLGTCNLGCAVHAKQGTAAVQIPAAQKNGVEVIPFCRVKKIEGNDVIAEIISPQFGQDPSPLKPGAYRFRAEKIVLSAGVIHSPTLLFRSGLGGNLPALGRYFTCQPALMLAGEHPRPIQNSEGHPKSFYCDEFYHSQHFLLETCMYFPFTFAKSLSGFGEELDDLMNHFHHLQMILVLVIDEAEAHNRIRIDRQGNPLVDYRFSSRSKQAFVDAMKASTRILFSAGCRRVHAPASKRFLINREEESRIDELISMQHFKLGKIAISAAHLMGGCRMGDDPQTSVTDSWGRVHGHKNLYVADASLFPAACEINPYLTIMALADRVAEGIKKS